MQLRSCIIFVLVAQVAAASFMRRNSGGKKKGDAKSISSKRGSGAKVIGVEDATTTPQAAAYDADATAQAADPAQPNADWHRRATSAASTTAAAAPAT